MNPLYRARILVVEDDLHIQSLLRYLLRPHFDLDTASSMREGLQKATAADFDLFLIDINLGEQRTGVDLLVDLRAMPSYGATPAIACTAYALHGDRDRFLACGFNAYLAKPFTRRKLLDLVQTTLADASLITPGKQAAVA